MASSLKHKRQSASAALKTGAKNQRDAAVEKTTQRTRIAWRTVIIVGALAGILSLGLLFVLDTEKPYMFQIIDVCNVIGLDQKILFLPLYFIPIFFPDMLFGVAHIPSTTASRALAVFLFNFVVYGGIAALYYRAKSKKKFWWILGISAAAAIALVLIYGW